MDYSFDDKIDVKLIALFIVDNFKMAVPSFCIVDILTLLPFVNYFDLQQQLAELEQEEFVTYYIEDNARYYSLTDRGKEALEYFSLRIPKTVRERILRAIKLKVKELKASLGIRADYKKINDIEYGVSLGISEGNSELFGVTLSVGDEIMAKKVCTAFKEDPQALYSEILSVLLNDNL